MSKSLVVLAVLAVTAPGLAFAGETQQGNKSTGPALTATQMSDTEMDKVTAGTAGPALLTVTPGGTAAPTPNDHALVFGAGQSTGGYPGAPGTVLPVTKGAATFQ